MYPHLFDSSVMNVDKRPKHVLPYVLQNLARYIQKNSVHLKYQYFHVHANRLSVHQNGSPRNGVNVLRHVERVCNHVL